MNKQNPIEKAKYIENEFREYIKSTYYLENNDWNEKFKQELDKTILLKGPYISRNLEFQTTKTINDLIKEGIVHPDFKELGDIKLDRKLYWHQEKAIRLIHQKHNLILTTGTASGKTESFLYPIINEILHEKNIEELGIRAIFLFPMNALVNDQFDRVRKILCKYPKIKYAYFTGNIEEKINNVKTEREHIKSITEIDVKENELLDRESIRKTPPHILFTNYSMLEYILLRPKDGCLFQNNKLKYIVLDEAHIYKGALGIEIGMLMRRLLQRISNKNVQFILASATLGENTEEGIKKIQDFGQNLTSKQYYKEDILFANKIELNSNNAKYQVVPKDYEDLYHNFNSNKLKELLNKYNVVSHENNLEAALYDLVIHDKNLYFLNEFLSNNSMHIEELLEKMKNFDFATIEMLSAFVDIICKCKKYDLKIMDIKYHSFIRTIPGIYITLGENPQISLNQRQYIDNKRAFEIGTCLKCNFMYIIGIEMNNTLYQNDSIDLYENYRDNENTKVDYFILEDEIIDLDPNKEKLIKYLLCPICAKLINDNTADKSLICEHNDVKKIVIYKINNEKSKIKNNLTQCPICKARSNTGLISTINMGKDAATALVTQIFFETIEQKEKQILAFSDSRQQAAFSVKFCETKHHDLLRKRLLFEILKDKERISFDDAEAKLDELIDSLDLFDTNASISPTKQAKITLLKEILKIDGIYSGEGIGLYYFEYRPIHKLKDEDLNNFLQNFHLSINVEEFKQYLDFIVNIIRTLPAVNYSGLTKDDREKYFAYKMFDNHITLIKTKDKDNNSVYGLISNHKNSKSKLEKYTQKLFNLKEEDANELIANIWKAFKDKEILKEDDEKNQLYSLWAEQFDLHKYSDTKWFFCKNCRKITRFNAKNICQNCLEKNKLEEINPDEKLANNYYRYQYKNKKIEKLVYQEHTAQLSNEKAAKIQKNFKNKRINYLSCSTTFEMGIDIGSLENVLLRNVPPSPVNYIQRAGRAGRGQDTSAFVLTYCSKNSHDYTFFEYPLRMIDANCNTPVFKMENHKIMYRHLIAMGLSEFFKNNTSAFTSVKSFYLDGWFDKFIKYLQAKPYSIINSTNVVLSSTQRKDLMDAKWIDNVFNDKEYEIKTSKVNFENLWKELQDGKSWSYREQDSEAIKYFEGLINRIEQDKNLIKKLSESNLIPKYGFPTDLVELRINDIGIKTDDYELVREMKIALSEYAIDSEVMVDKKIITSKYVNRVKDLPTTYYYECNNCHKTILKDHAGVIICPDQTCKNKINKNSPFFITPIFGFTGKLKQNTQNQLKPKHSYCSPLKYVGNGTLDGQKIKINDYLEFYSSKNDELLIVNENNFFICNECGYGIINEKNEQILKKQEPHNAIYWKCSNDELTKQSLGFSYKTDVLKMVLLIPFENGNNETLSVLYAILEGITLAFDIERNDIDGIYISEEGRQIFVLFDTVPGGAGHVKRLLDIQEMKKAFEYAYEKVNQNCCDTSCYSCIRNYKNQKYHKYLDRKLARNYLDKLIKTFNINNNLTNN